MYKKRQTKSVWFLLSSINTNFFYYLSSVSQFPCQRNIVVKCYCSKLFHNHFSKKCQSIDNNALNDVRIDVMSKDSTRKNLLWIIIMKAISGKICKQSTISRSLLSCTQAYLTCDRSSSMFRWFGNRINNENSSSTNGWKWKISVGAESLLYPKRSEIVHWTTVIVFIIFVQKSDWGSLKWYIQFGYVVIFFVDINSVPGCWRMGNI